MARSAPRTARAIAREHLTAQILTTARQHLSQHGPSELSLRAVARELGMASSAVYRYVSSRDQLLTLLLIEVFQELGTTVEAAEAQVADRDDLWERWMASCRAVRDWAKTHPFDYALLYGSPVPGYAAPQETVPAASRVTDVFLGILADVPTPDRPDPGLARPDHADALNLAAGQIPETTSTTMLLRGVLAWTAVFGTVSFELFGHLEGAVLDYDRYAELAFSQLAQDLLGLSARTP